MIRKLFVVVLLAASGCATSPIPAEQAAAVPSDRINFVSPQSASTGTLIVTRDGGFLGGGCYLAFTIDGELAATFDPGETARFHVTPGDHIIGVDHAGGAGLCALDAGLKRETSVTVQGREEKRFRIAVRPGDGPVVEPTTR